VASLSQGRTAAAQCGLFTYKSVPVIFEPPCIYEYIYAQCEGKFVPLNAMKMSRNSRGLVPLILNFGARWKLMVSITLGSLFSRGQRLSYPTSRMLGGSQGQSGLFVEV